jgi:predicted metal-binding membrane protein
MMPLRDALTRGRLVLALLAFAALAWWWSAARMAGMDAAPGADLGTLGWFTATWVAMMAAMMLPSFVPTLGAYAARARERRAGRALVFTCGYLLAWAAAGLLGYGVFEAGKGLLAGELTWDGGGRWLAAGVLVAAAGYELVPLKRACLARCRGEQGATTGISQHGAPAALAMGVRSGAWCIGCSWALMAALFALGVMSLVWMAAIAALVALEKLGPRPRLTRLAAAALLGALAVAIVAAPHDVPGLVVPHSTGMRAMSAMG